jgi:DNA-binding XRE family transcriptional regulator
MAAVLLLTHRSSFEVAWSAPLHRHELSTRPLSPAGVMQSLTRGAGLLIDADSAEFSDDELLGCLAVARMRDVVSAIALGTRKLRVQHDLLCELCAGLIARDEGDYEAVAAGLARRLERARAERFAHLGPLPLGDELAAIFDDGNVALLSRPWSAQDTGAPLSEIALVEGGLSAKLTLQDGCTFSLGAADVAPSPNGSTASVPPGSPLGDVDGVRLGHRLRALRIAAGLTQAELARRTGIHRPNIARVEAGRHTPSLETLARLAAAIGVSTTRVLAD